MILYPLVVRSGGYDREFGKRRSEFLSFLHFSVDFRRCEIFRRPKALSLALYAGVEVLTRRAVDVDAVLPLTLPPVARGMAVAPFELEQVGAHLLELVPTAGRR
jgi:hypothetical protein